MLPHSCIYLSKNARQHRSGSVLSSSRSRDERFCRAGEIEQHATAAQPANMRRGGLSDRLRYRRALSVQRAGAWMNCYYAWTRPRNRRVARLRITRW